MKASIVGFVISGFEAVLNLWQLEVYARLFAERRLRSGLCLMTTQKLVWPGQNSSTLTAPFNRAPSVFQA